MNNSKDRKNIYSSWSFKKMAKRLAIARRRAGFRSSRSFAKTHDIAVTTYHNHESGKRSMGIPTALFYCELLKVSICWLITGQGEGK